MSRIELAARVAHVAESATLALNARAKQLATEGRKIFNLTAGELATDTPDYIESAVAKNLHFNKYSPVPGLPEVRDAVAHHARDYYGLDWVQAANVVLTPGAKTALYATFLTLINPGDEVIVPMPAWVSYLNLIELVGGVPVQVQLTDDYDLDVAAITSSITPKTKAIIINSPHNPTGAIFSSSALEDLAKALKDSSVTVIADDIYSQLVFTDDFKPVPSLGFDNMIIINGLSKSQSLTGWRIGYLIADKPVAEAATNLVSHMTGNAPLPGQYAILAAMERQDRPPEGTVEDLIKQRDSVLQALEEIPGLKHNVPGGAFYIFLDVRELAESSAQWCEDLLMDAGVALVPGEAFGAPGFARLTFVQNTDYLLGAVAQIKQFVAQSSPQTAPRDLSLTAS